MKDGKCAKCGEDASFVVAACDEDLPAIYLCDEHRRIPHGEKKALMRKQLYNSPA